MSLVKKIANFIVSLSLVGLALAFFLALTSSLLNFDLIAEGNSALKIFLNLETFNRLGFLSSSLILIIFLYTHFISISGLQENFDILNFDLAPILFFYVIVSPLAIFFFVLGLYGTITPGVGDIGLVLANIFNNALSIEVIKKLIIISIGLYVFLAIAGMRTRLYFYEEIGRRKKFLELKKEKARIIERLKKGESAQAISLDKEF